MSAADRFIFAVAILLLWLLALVLVGVLHSFEVVSSDYLFSLMISFMI